MQNSTLPWTVIQIHKQGGKVVGNSFYLLNTCRHISYVNLNLILIASSDLLTLLPTIQQYWRNLISVRLWEFYRLVKWASPWEFCDICDIFYHNGLPSFVSYLTQTYMQQCYWISMYIWWNFSQTLLNVEQIFTRNYL